MKRPRTLYDLERNQPLSPFQYQTVVAQNGWADEDSEDNADENSEGQQHTRRTATANYVCEPPVVDESKRGGRRPQSHFPSPTLPPPAPPPYFFSRSNTSSGFYNPRLNTAGTQNPNHRSYHGIPLVAAELSTPPQSVEEGSPDTARSSRRESGTLPPEDINEPVVPYLPEQLTEPPPPLPPLPQQQLQEPDKPKHSTVEERALARSKLTEIQREPLIPQRSHSIQQKAPKRVVRSEWREIHARSMTRVDSILRQAAGLSSSIDKQPQHCRQMRNRDTIHLYSQTGNDSGGLGISVPLPATVPAVRSVTSQTGSATNRLIHMSRDEQRRSRLFAEYEKLVDRPSSSESGHETEECEDSNESAVVGEDDDDSDNDNDKAEVEEELDADEDEDETDDGIVEMEDEIKSRLPTTTSGQASAKTTPQAAIRELPDLPEKQESSSVVAPLQLDLPSSKDLYLDVTEALAVRLQELNGEEKEEEEAASSSSTNSENELESELDSDNTDSVSSESDSSSSSATSTEISSIGSEDEDMDIGGGQHEEDMAEPESLESSGATVRHSELVRQQLKSVEGRVPTSQLGVVLSSKDDLEHRELLEAYMKRYEFQGQAIDVALRQLIRELQLPTESQQIDRVISVFAHWYHACNQGLYISAEVVYAYAFAILLLHTDAHNPRIRQKMAKPQFIARAKLLDEEHSTSGKQSEMFDEVLDILYENVTASKFEYAPASMDLEQPKSAGSSPVSLVRPQTATASPGITAWLRRVFMSSTAASSTSSSTNTSPFPASSATTVQPTHAIPSKEQFSYAPPTFPSPDSAVIMSTGIVTGAPAATTTTNAADGSPSSTRNPHAMETIRLSSVRSHVRRRVSLQKGRPPSGIVVDSEGGPGHSTDIQQLEQPQEPVPEEQEREHPLLQELANSNAAMLRIEMAGRVSRKIERLDSGRRGLVRWWKDAWMALSGSRLYFFRPTADSGQANGKSARTIQSIISLRHGVAIVDTKYKKYPHVFRVLGADGCQILIKAPDDDAVAEWMARINCAAAFKTMGVERRPVAPSSLAMATATAASDSHSGPTSLSPPANTNRSNSESRTALLRSKLAALNHQLNDIDDRLERSLRLFKQIVSLVPLTRYARSRSAQYLKSARERLQELYLLELQLTCYKDVLELDLAIENELSDSQHPQ